MVTPLIKQIWVMSGVLLAKVEIGMFLGLSTCLLPALQDPQSDIKATLEMSSWIVTAFSMTFIPANIISTRFLDKYGRRITFLLNLIPGAIGLLLMYFATNVHCLIIARALEGFTFAAASLLGAIVIGEYSDPVHRGMFLNLKTTSLYLGSAIVHFLGNYYHWRTIVLVTLIFYIINLGIVWMWPESPPWLASKNDFEKCEKTFYWLRGKNEQSTKELKEMLKAQQERSEPKQLSFLENILRVCRKFKRKDFILPLRIYIFAAILLETSGRHIYPAYAVQIIAGISEPKSSVYYILCFDILITTSTLFSSVLIRIFKRRILLFTTGTVAFVILIGTCVYLYLTSIYVITFVPLIPMSLFGLYLAVVNLACTPIPLALLGEIFPLEHKALGTTFAGIFIALFLMIGLKITPILLATVKTYGTFSIFGIVMAVSLVFLYFILPETKDRTLQEIEDYFNYGGFNTKNRLQEDAEVKMKMIS